METLFRYIVKNIPEAKVFGGAVRDMLLGLPLKGDIDIFVPDDRTLRLVSVAIRRYLNFLTNATHISTQSITTFDYEIALPRPTCIFFRLNGTEHRHIDIVKLADDAPKNVDFDVNSLYIDNGELKTLLPEFTVKDILTRLAKHEMQQIFFPTKDTDPMLTARFYERVAKMKDKGFCLSGTGFYGEKTPLVSMVELLRLPPVFRMENLLTNCYITGITAVAFYYLKCLPTKAVIVADENADVLRCDLSLQRQDNVLRYPGGELKRCSQLENLKRIEYLKYCFDSKTFSSVDEEKVPFSEIETMLKSCCISEEITPELKALGFRSI